MTDYIQNEALFQNIKTNVIKIDPCRQYVITNEKKNSKQMWNGPRICREAALLNK